MDDIFAQLSCHFNQIPENQLMRGSILDVTKSWGQFACIESPIPTSTKSRFHSPITTVVLTPFVSCIFQSSLNLMRNQIGKGQKKLPISEPSVTSVECEVAS